MKIFMKDNMEKKGDTKPATMILFFIVLILFITLVTVTFLLVTAGMNSSPIF